MDDYTYTGWLNERQLDSWPTIRLTETARGPRCCAHCRGRPAAHVILDAGPVWLCAEGVAERRAEWTRYRAAVRTEEKPKMRLINA